MYENIVHPKMLVPESKKYNTDCFSTEDLLRTIQFIPSPNYPDPNYWLEINIDNPHQCNYNIDTNLTPGWQNESFNNSNW